MITEPEKAALRVLLREAGAKLLSFWPGGPGGGATLGASEKSDGSLVTRADYASNDILLAGLLRIFPGDSVHSEELHASDETFQEERVWIIDPLDGTAVFLRGTDEFSVLVALTLSGEPELGFMYFPARDLLLEGERGNGATINDRTLRVSPAKTLGAERVYARSLELKPPRARYPGNLDSGHAFLLLASGELDAVALRLDKLREWDLAAPAIVLEEAGGKVSDESGRRIRYRPGSLPKVFAGSNGTCHDELLEMLSL